MADSKRHFIYDFMKLGRCLPSSTITMLPATPFATVPLLFLSPGDSDLRQFLSETHDLATQVPDILQWIDADLDAHALRKKALRMADKQWIARQTLPLPGTEPVAVPTASGEISLEQGRPRTPAYVVFMALVLRGYFGEGFKACSAATMILESTTLSVLFNNMGVQMPRPSTLTELVNAVTVPTRQRILDAQIAQVLRLGWDDFTVMLQDSTHVEGNTAWPTDSRLLVAFVARLLRVGASLVHLGLPIVHLPKVRWHLKAITDLDREIDMTRGTREGARNRRRRYEKLLWRAQRAQHALNIAVTEREAALAVLDILPTRLAMATRVVALMRTDVTALQTVIDNCKARVIDQKKVRMADKKLSISDSDAGFIAKGQRDPVIGYKPQVARSGGGFVTGLLLPQGNASDSGQLEPMVHEVIRRTTRIPRVVSVDDGYASRANVEMLRRTGIDVVSINGSKGKALTACTDWESEEYSDARKMRSAVESLMFTLKEGFNFGEVARRGLAPVHGELLEKVLAYNLSHMVRVRRSLAMVDDEAARAMAA